MDSSRDAALSTYREALIEHLFLAALLGELWRVGKIAEVLKPSSDHAGYDLLIDCDGQLRSVQLKSSLVDARPSSQKVNRALANRPNGCVIWISFDQEKRTISGYRWFGAKGEGPLPDLSAFKTARHTKANTAGAKTFRPAIKVLPRSEFLEVRSIAKLVVLMFGPQKRQVSV